MNCNDATHNPIDLYQVALICHAELPVWSANIQCVKTSKPNPLRFCVCADAEYPGDHRLVEHLPGRRALYRQRQARAGDEFFRVYLAQGEQQFGLFIEAHIVAPLSGPSLTSGRTHSSGKKYVWMSIAVMAVVDSLD